MHIIRLSLLFILLNNALSAAVVVLNNDVPKQAISVESIRDYLLGRSNTWQDGSAVVIVLCDDPDDDEVIKNLTCRSTNLLLRSWKRLVFSGTGAMPKTAGSKIECLELVARTAGAFTVLAEPPAPSDRYRIVPLQQINDDQN